MSYILKQRTVHLLTTHQLQNIKTTLTMLFDFIKIYSQNFHFIGISMVSCLLSLILYSKNKIFSIHEYSMNRIHSEEKILKRFITKLTEMVVYFFSCKKFIFFSKTEKDKAAHEIGYLKKNKIKLIPFGPFETYAYHSVKSLQIFEKHSYFLFSMK